MIIKLTIDDLTYIKEMTEKTWEGYTKQYRDKNTIKKNVFIGKLGEIAFKRMYEKETNTVFDEDKIDPGFDFVLHGQKIDVKTLEKSHYSKVFINPKSLNNYDYLALMKIISIDRIGAEIEFYGYCKKNNALNSVKGYKNAIDIVVSYIFDSNFEKIEI